MGDEKGRVDGLCWGVRGGRGDDKARGIYIMQGTDFQLCKEVKSNREPKTLSRSFSSGLTRRGAAQQLDTPADARRRPHHTPHTPAVSPSCPHPPPLPFHASALQPACATACKTRDGAVGGFVCSVQAPDSPLAATPEAQLVKIATSNTIHVPQQQGCLPLSSEISTAAYYWNTPQFNLLHPHAMSPLKC